MQIHLEVGAYCTTCLYLILELVSAGYIEG